MGFLPNRKRQEAIPAQQAGTIAPEGRTTDKSSDRTLTPGDNSHHVSTAGVDIKRATKARKRAIYVTSFLYFVAIIFLILVSLEIPGILTIAIAIAIPLISQSSPHPKLTHISDNNWQYKQPCRHPRYLVLPARPYKHHSRIRWRWHHPAKLSSPFPGPSRFLPSRPLEFLRRLQR